MSLLLVAVLVPVQAAGCCRLAAVLGVPQKTGIRTGIQPAGDPPSHACCPRKAAASDDPAGSPAAAAVAAQAAEAPASAPEPAAIPGAAEPGKPGEHCGAGSRNGSTGCCLEGAPHADPGLVSTESGPVFPVSSRLQPSGGPLPAAPSLPALALPADSGPPVYLACRRLLI